MEASTIILNLAYIGLVSATFTRTILWLRGMLVAAAIGFVAFGLLTDLTSMVVWNVITGSLHTAQIVRYVRGRRGVVLSDEDEQIRSTLFPSLDRFDFFTMWSMGEETDYRDGSQLTTVGEPLSALGLLLDGEVDVRRAGESLNRITAGSLVGEVSLASGGSATADTFAVGAVRMREWQRQVLTTLDQLNPNAARALRTCISRELAARVR